MNYKSFSILYILFIIGIFISCGSETKEPLPIETTEALPIETTEAYHLEMIKDGNIPHGIFKLSVGTSEYIIVRGVECVAITKHK